MSCENVRERLLDHLYGALPDDEERDVVTHLARCPDCRAALEIARTDKEELGRAARLDLPGLSFDPPRGRVRRIFTARRVAAAAAILVAVVGLLVYRARLREPVLEEHPRLVVQGPASLPSDAASEFLVRTETIEGEPIPAAIRARIWNGNETPAFDRTLHSDPDGETRVAIPEGLGRPGEVLAVSFLAVYEGGEELGAAMVTLEPTRLAAYVTTDKPLYRPGEPIRARAVVLSRFNLKPAGRVPVSWKLLDAKDNVVRQRSDLAEESVGSAEFRLPTEAAGEFRVVISHPQGAFAEVERKVTVRSYRVPRMKTDLELDRESYGPGEKATAFLSVERAEGGVPEGAEVEAVVTVDGEETHRESLTLRNDGTASVSFTLPESIEEGRAQLLLTIRDGGTVETAAKTVPVTLDRLSVDLFPEGGELVAGFENRVYFAVRDPKGDPADLVADVIDGEGRTVAEARTDLLGMGRFSFLPRAGESYRLLPRTPAQVTLDGGGIEAIREGVVLTAKKDVTGAEGKLSFRVASTIPGEHTLVAWCRGVLVAQETVRLDGKSRESVTLEPTSDVGGVFRVTVLDPAGRPRAERLVSRVPARRVDVQVRPEKATYAPGEKVRVTVVTTDEHGRAVPATLGVSVVDDAVLTLANDEDTAPLPLHFLLGMEVEELEEAELFAEGEDSARAVDLLLGVQGWRRFAWEDPGTFLADHPDAGPRVVAPLAAGETLITLDTIEAARAGAARGLMRADRKTLRGAGWILAAVGIAAAAWLLVRLRRPLRSWKPYAGLGYAIVGVLLALLAAPVLVPEPEDPPKRLAQALLDRDVDGDGEDLWVERFSIPSYSGLLLDGDMAWAGLFPGEDINLIPSGGFGFEDWTYWWSANRDGIPYLKGIYDSGSHPGITITFSEGLDPATVKSVYVTFDGLASDVNILTTTFNRRPLKIYSLYPMRISGILSVSGGASYRSGYYQPVRLVREYAHVRRPSPGGVRQDFTEVLYWHPRLVTGANGRATFEFETCDSVTSFSVGVEAHDGRGALAAAASEFSNRIPFWIEPKLPTALGQGDRLRLPVGVANETSADATAKIDLAGVGSESVTVPAGERGRVTFDVTATGRRFEVKLEGRGPNGLTDRVERTVPVVPTGYPMHVDRSGVLSKSAETTLLLAESVDRETLSGSLRLYPSVLSSLEDGIDSMLRTPSGCFEQASSTTYPNVLILACISDQGVGSPGATRKAKEYLKKGYELLAGYECDGGGFEWFGGDPAHEALTAYGLMEFTEMARFIDVDSDLLDRTRKWLLSRRDGQGGFLTGKDSHAFGSAPREIHDAYIVWALTEAGGADDLEVELDLLAERAGKSEDPYLLALAVLALGNADRPEADDLAQRLVEFQDEDGSLTGASTSITSSRGRNLAVETSALAVLAFLREGRTQAAGGAMAFLTENRRHAGGFGATQATVLSLTAIVEHSRATRRVSCAHDLTVFVNGRIAAHRDIPEGTTGVITFERELLDALDIGKNEIEIRTSGAEELPWGLSLAYTSSTPPSDPDCAVGIATSLARNMVAEGESVELLVEIENREQDGIPMVVARIGLPAGLVPRPDQLTERKNAGEFDRYEIRPREVTLYFRGLGPEETRRIHLDLIADIPGDFKGPASSAYLYYTDDSQDWAPPLEITIR